MKKPSDLPLPYCWRYWDIHEQCLRYGVEKDGYINYMKGANIAGFMKVAHAMMGLGVC